jgi:hypothetical protein
VAPAPASSGVEKITYEHDWHWRRRPLFVSNAQIFAVLYDFGQLEAVRAATRYESRSGLRSTAALRRTARILLDGTYVEAHVIRVSGSHIRLEVRGIAAIPNRFQVVFDSEPRAYEARLLWLEGTFALVQVEGEDADPAEADGGTG